ncbi:MAG: hypothetical protein M0P21_03275 [Methanoculleus sp.]|uniref:hypothetical protein n=1 Tax=Methanoculleus nereidis TaxID=2735141 RepID=UPI0029438930|nr:hypothetical protein [Methanoculleus sp. YWC-01]MCK9297971.1 hypothetical protein [Methanoculleus sp.]
MLLFAFSLSAACTGSGDPAGPSPQETATITETPAPTTTTVSLTPGPTETVPPGKEIEFEVMEGLTPTITDDLRIVFVGGKGQDFVKSIDVRVTKSTGEVVDETMQPIRGDELIIQNAKGENRVEISVTLVTGGPYKIIDRIVAVS